MNAKDYKIVSDALLEIDDNVSGITVQPREMGDTDLDTVLELHKYMCDKMPKEMYALYQEIGTTIKSSALHSSDDKYSAL
jgi:hypothetical protein